MRVEHHTANETAATCTCASCCSGSPSAKAWPFKTSPPCTVRHITRPAEAHHRHKKQTGGAATSARCTCASSRSSAASSFDAVGGAGAVHPRGREGRAPGAGRWRHRGLRRTCASACTTTSTIRWTPRKWRSSRRARRRSSPRSGRRHHRARADRARGDQHAGGVDRRRDAATSRCDARASAVRTRCRRVRKSRHWCRSPNCRHYLSRRLKALTGGEGTYTMDLSHYDPAPPRRQQELVAAFKPQEEVASETRCVCSRAHRAAAGRTVRAVLLLVRCGALRDPTRRAASPSSRNRACTRPTDLHRVRRIYRGLRGIAGHNVKPYGDLDVECPGHPLLHSARSVALQESLARLRPRGLRALGRRVVDPRLAECRGRGDRSEGDRPARDARRIRRRRRPSTSCCSSSDSLGEPGFRPEYCPVMTPRGRSEPAMWPGNRPTSATSRTRDPRSSRARPAGLRFRRARISPAARLPRCGRHPLGSQPAGDRLGRAAVEPPAAQLGVQAGADAAPRLRRLNSCRVPRIAQLDEAAPGAGATRGRPRLVGTGRIGVRPRQRGSAPRGTRTGDPTSPPASGRNRSTARHGWRRTRAPRHCARGTHRATPGGSRGCATGSRADRTSTAWWRKNFTQLSIQRCSSRAVRMYFASGYSHRSGARCGSTGCR